MRLLGPYLCFFSILNLTWIVPAAIRLIEYNRSNVREALAGIAASAFLFFIGEIFYRWRMKYYQIILLLLVPGSVFACLHALSMGEVPHVLNTVSIFDTNLVEAKEFFSQYFSYSCLFWFIPLFLPIVWLFTPKACRLFNSRKASLWLLLVMLGVTISPLIIRYIRHHHKKNWWNVTIHNPYYRYLPIQFYITLLEAHKTYLIPKEIVPNLNGLVKEKPSILGQNLSVIVIGESITRQHMGLYGYSRKTTPRLYKLSPELIIFDKVWTTTSNTIYSVTQALSVNINGKLVPIFSVLKQAGFITEWISNQPRIGIWESRISVFVSGADKKIYLNQNHGGILADDIPSYDEKVLNEVKKVIEYTNKPKVVFIHLMGAHTDYSKRFPKNYRIFKDIPRKDRNPKHLKIINDYDNAILYNDFVVSSIIDILKNSNVSSTLLYFSDHGDDVFESSDSYFGHSPQFLSSPMRQIPFILWSSKGFSKSSINCDRVGRLAFRLDHLAEFLAV